MPSLMYLLNPPGFVVSPLEEGGGGRVRLDAQPHGVHVAVRVVEHSAQQTLNENPKGKTILGTL